MRMNRENCKNIFSSSVAPEVSQRYLNPADINLPQGYQVEVFASGLDAPNSMDFNNNGELIIAESGIVSGEARIYRLSEGRFDLVAEGFQAPITGIHCLGMDIFVSHRGNITLVKQDGSIQNILSGLPSNGDYGNSNITIGNDGKMYWGQGSITNCGVVGVDNDWVFDYPFLHDNPGAYIILNGQNFESKNILALQDQPAFTGAFSPFGEKNVPFEMRKGVVKASGSILRANQDGSDMELVAWGIRYPSHVKFDRNYRLFVSNQGYDDRGSRPIANAPDEFLLVEPGMWYGWPDYAGGEPVTSARFRPEGGQQPEFLLTNHPSIVRRPYAVFPHYSAIMGFDFNYDESFGPYGDVYITEFGGTSLTETGEPSPYSGFGHRVSKISMSTGEITTFAINKSGFPASITREGGFGYPTDLIFGPDRAMYVLDYGINITPGDVVYKPSTGVIWRISKTI